jgi:hypothetical protein
MICTDPRRPSGVLALDALTLGPCEAIVARLPVRLQD